MKTVTLLRHAKSDWEDRRQHDHDRPLAARGERAASLMGAYLEQESLCPDVVLCSTARRAVQTLERVLPYLRERPEVFTERDLYLAPAGRMLERVRKLPVPSASVLLVVHYPGVQDLALALAGRGDRDAGARLQRKYPTAGLAQVSFEVDRWDAIEPAGGTLVRFVAPKDLV